MKSKNLWQFNKEENLRITEQIFELMSDQCEYLKDGTKGRVSGKFEIEEPSVISRMVAFQKDMSFNNFNARNSDKEDANDLYKNQWYSFIIFNEVYSFRVFSVEIGPVFPVTVKLDEDIYNEIGKLQNVAKSQKENSITINSYSGFEQIVKNVFSTTKVLYLIKELRKNS